jgi:hypothetical protein
MSSIASKPKGGRPGAGDLKGKGWGKSRGVKDKRVGVARPAKGVG